MTTDPNIAMQQWIAAGTEIVRAAFAEGADDGARNRAARICRVMLQMLEASPPTAADITELPAYQPRPPATFAEYIAHVMQNPQDLATLLGPALGPTAPAALGMLRNALMRPAPPSYR